MRGWFVVLTVVFAFFAGAHIGHHDTARFESEITRLQDEADYRDDVINDLILEIGRLDKKGGTG